MTLAAGTSLGSYEITNVIGAGGMGEVYRARDTKLHRDVAIKVLPELFAIDPERLTRFEREAQVLASLNHPHIAQIYGVEQGALVMELVEGEDLAQRIARGALPIDEALQVAKQIADALDAAHESGIVHRDLKPANVKLRQDGVVKVLDFGLAKAADALAGSAFSGHELPNSPTFTSPAVMTRMGVILGTAGYMSPEQARGKAVDRRSDLWAFGVVLYEMLTGRTAFEGDTVTDVLAAIVTKEPDWTALPPNTPPAVRRLLQRCLTRDPRRRLSAAAEAKYQIEDALAAPAEAPVQAVPPAKSRAAMRAVVVPWTMVVVLAAAVAYIWWRAPSITEESLHYSVEPPVKSSVSIVSRPAIALSRDGRQLAFVATGNGITRLYVRTRDDFDARALVGTEGASEPVFSPDGRWLAFFANNALYKISVDGGPLEMLARVNDPRGLSWDTSDVITYTPEATGGVYQVESDHPLTPKPISTLTAPQERTHRWPQALPGNRAVLFTVGTITSPDNYDGATIEAVVLATSERRVLLKGASMARFMAPGYLLFARGPSVFAVKFSPDRLDVEGAPRVVIQGVGGDATTGASNFALSDTGALAYFPGVAVGTQHQLIWASADGTSVAAGLPAGAYFDVRLSPDGRRVALQSIAGAGSDVWVHDFARKTFTRLTFGGQNRTPVWSADGSTVYYVSLDPMGNASRILRRPADGSSDAEIVAALKSRIFLKNVSGDGRSALIEYSTNANKTDIGTVPLGRDGPPVPIVASEFDEYCAALSPNGRWLAYQSDESSRAEIYVREIGGKGGRWQISSEGGEEPHWSSKGDELYYRNDTLFMAAHIDAGPVFQYSPPRKLFDGVFNLRAESGISYDVDPAANRFLMIRLASEQTAPSSIRVITNWARELARVMARRQ